MDADPISGWEGKESAAWEAKAMQLRPLKTKNGTRESTKGARPTRTRVSSPTHTPVRREGAHSPTLSEVESRRLRPIANIFFDPLSSAAKLPVYVVDRRAGDAEQGEK